jgi:hypothetical protein
MVRAIVLVGLGAALGAGGVYCMLKAPISQEGRGETVAPQALSCESELASQRSRIAELENRISSQQRPATASVLPATEQPPPVEEQEAANRAIAWRVSAIEKFVSISEEQKQRLQEKFKEEQEARQENRESDAETLEEIIGQEQAATYRQQVQAAFERAQNQELDKEALWISRKLSLTPDQEQSMRTIFSDVESQIDKEFGDGQHGAALSAQQRVARMVAENKRRLQLRSDALKRVLQPDQYTAYLQEESQSAASDVEVFHDAGASDSTDAK